MSDPKNPQVGDTVFDGEEFQAYIVDLEPGDLQGMLTKQPGFEEVKQEILSNQNDWGARAGVTPEDITELELINGRIARIDAFVRPVQKFVEMLIETRYQLEDRRQRFALNVAQSVDRRGVRDPQLLAKYELTRTYRSAVAKKGVATRRKKAASTAKPPAAEP
jgi:hypothetical protein